MWFVIVFGMTSSVGVSMSVFLAKYMSPRSDCNLGHNSG